jgi:hypothetical protein
MDASEKPLRPEARGAVRLAAHCAISEIRSLLAARRRFVIPALAFFVVCYVRLHILVGFDPSRLSFSSPSKLLNSQSRLSLDLGPTPLFCERRLAQPGAASPVTLRFSRISFTMWSSLRPSAIGWVGVVAAMVAVTLRQTGESEHR